MEDVSPDFGILAGAPVASSGFGGVGICFPLACDFGLSFWLFGAFGRTVGG